MTKHCENRILLFSSESTFKLIAYVENYPEFVPFWHYAKIWRRSGDVYYTDQEIGTGPMRERLQSKTFLQPFRNNDSHRRRALWRSLVTHCWLQLRYLCSTPSLAITG
nr:hypothetical protein [Gammaproteobacteria bacterium]